MSALKEYKRDLAASAVFIVCGAAFFVNVRQQEMMKYDLLGSKFFPQIACAGIVLLGLLLAVQSMRGIAKAGGEDEKTEATSAFLNKKQLIFIACTFAYFAALEFGAGFLYATPIYMFADMMLMSNGDRSGGVIARYAAYSVVVTVLTRLFFEKVLYLLLP